MGYELGRSLTNLGIGTSQKGEIARAAEIFTRAKAVFIDEKHAAGTALVDLYQAIVLSGTEDIAEAQRLCSAAGEFFRGSGLKRKAIVCDLLSSGLALAEGDLPMARHYCRTAFAQLKGLQGPVLSFQAHFLAGRIHESSGRPDRSRRAYQTALRQLENVRGSLQGEELRITFASNKVEVYERLIGLCLERGLTGAAAEEAFGYIERAKCRSLMDSMFGRAQPLATRPDSAGSRGDAANLRAQLNWYYHRIESEEIRREGVSAGRVEGLWAQARACEDQLLRLLRSKPGWPVHTCFSSGGRSAPRSPAAVALPEIRAALAPSSALVEYFQVRDELMAAVLTDAGLEVIPLAKAPLVRNRLRMLQFQLSKFRLGPGYTLKLEDTLIAATRMHLRALYDDLFAPVRRLLKATHLVLVPNGFLHYVPLHALHDGERYLIDQFTVSYAPSASIYAMLQRRTKVPVSGRSLILGVADERAPGILREAGEVAAILPEPLLLTGEQASRKALQEWGAASRIIHIATHGFLRTDNPMFSAVRLGDSNLSLYDLYNLRLPVELLTLSGCATGLNVVAAGDELLGLSRGLLYAGAQTLLLTLWDVHDSSTADFMRSFYLHLTAGISKAAALRLAVLELRNRYPHPYYWAPFTLVGRAP
jgi:tetratricopeptide (TPR) repeat protein